MAWHGGIASQEPGHLAVARLGRNIIERGPTSLNRLVRCSTTSADSPVAPHRMLPQRHVGGAPGALPVEDLLPDDVGVPVVLGEFAQHVEVHPAKREWPEPVAVDLVVQPQG